MEVPGGAASAISIRDFVNLQRLRFERLDYTSKSHKSGQMRERRGRLW